ncbi:DUF3119 domain-containing protein [filamentous cyanobacterium CCP5]|nr:DUF3119 domain-containing protein [filamentous cyanobacterium CCP5]
MVKTAGYRELTPRYAIPMGIVLLALPLFWVQIGLGGAIALFGLFLGFQTATLRLRFTPEAFELYRGERQIRQFPYRDWRHWEIFWPGIPILLYFREVKSIHFLPILFNVEELRRCLQDYCADSAPGD